MKTGMLYFIVDDDQDDQELFIEALQELDDNCKCITAFNGKDALQKLRNGMTSLPDFIFLDLNMPLMNGKQFLAEIKQSGDIRNVPVIIYSTSTNTQDVLDTIQLGAVFFLQKPNRFEDLSKALSGIISRKWDRQQGA
ncbi:MAG TPA: response regulator [Ferruginibacter sp.]|nr:response regulator [Ferruginibacter sp.]